MEELFSKLTSLVNCNWSPPTLQLRIKTNLIEDLRYNIGMVESSEDEGYGKDSSNIKYKLISNYDWDCHGVIVRPSDLNNKRCKISFNLGRDEVIESSSNGNIGFCYIEDQLFTIYIEISSANSKNFLEFISLRNSLCKKIDDKENVFCNIDIAAHDISYRDSTKTINFYVRTIRIS